MRVSCPSKLTFQTRREAFPENYARGCSGVRRGEAQRGRAASRSAHSQRVSRPAALQQASITGSVSWVLLWRTAAENTDTEIASLQIRPPDLKKSLTLKEVAGPQPASLKRGSLEASALLLCMRYTEPFHTTTFLKIQSLAESSAASRHCEPPWRAQSLLSSEQAKNGSEGASRLHLRGNGLAADSRVAQEVQHSARAASPQQGCHAYGRVCCLSRQPVTQARGCILRSSVATTQASTCSSVSLKRNYNLLRCLLA